MMMRMVMAQKELRSSRTKDDEKKKKKKTKKKRGILQ